MNSFNKPTHFCLIILVGLSLGAVSCSSHKNMALSNARSNYESAANDPEIVRGAPVALHEAKLSLDKAEALSKDSDNKNEVNHLAYIVNRKVETAKATAMQYQQQALLGRASETRNEVVLEARRKEIAQVKKQAEASLAKSQESESRAEDAELDSQEAQIELFAAEQREADLAAQLAELKSKETDVGTQLTLRDMMFETGKADLTAGGIRDIGKIAGIAKQNPKRSIVVEGHTDSLGSESYNLELSERRARAVQDSLIQNGVPASQVSIKGYGEAFPVASNANRHGRQLNRRVVVTILREGKKPSDIDNADNRL